MTLMSESERRAVERHERSDAQRADRERARDEWIARRIDLSRTAPGSAGEWTPVDDASGDGAADGEG